MAGLMLPTWFLSMWISNTATTAMMAPIANAILLQLKETEDMYKNCKNNYICNNDGYNNYGY
ncbi:hypothetical protein DPMN_134038 [Dreissena polymorpha]|uniref:Uncharacterized protein n=1 Tax=Dreissena polymorpha TaxID=45954 RepID=A0A9D4JAC8_DREPO|nr:hypothetical protein DPMN_164292 [Dreissena polymorpha]KAH3805731.1 hypothetical protein DPMN_134038 [Dreissena polymorpha]